MEWREVGCCGAPRGGTVRPQASRPEAVKLAPVWPCPTCCRDADGKIFWLQFPFKPQKKEERPPPPPPLAGLPPPPPMGMGGLPSRMHAV